MPKKFIKPISLLLCFCFFFTQTGLAQLLPTQQGLSPQGTVPVVFQLPVLRYLSVNTANPSNYFNFLMDKGEPNRDGSLREPSLNQEAAKLIHYFFLGLTLPSESFWVNLKPQEPERITSEELAKTDLGRTLLEQDLKLKKDMANYLHPKHPQGKLYWEKLYQAIGKDKAKKVTITSSNRVWIVPAEAVVLETEDGALVAKATLKVLLESEYLSLSRKTEKLKNRKTEKLKNEEEQIRIISESLMKEIILPSLTKDINESPGYAPLRQVYHSLILAEWYKRKQGLSPKGTVPNNNPYSKYINSGTTAGLESELPWEKQAIWQEYLKSYQEGEYKLQDTIFGLKRMYFSGGVLLTFDGLAGSSLLTIITKDEFLKNPVLQKDIPKNPGGTLVVVDTKDKDPGNTKIEAITVNEPKAPSLPESLSVLGQPKEEGASLNKKTASSAGGEGIFDKKMGRRGFLKLALGAGVAVLIPTNAIASVFKILGITLDFEKINLELDPRVRIVKEALSKLYPWELELLARSNISIGELKTPGIRTGEVRDGKILLRDGDGFDLHTIIHEIGHIMHFYIMPEIFGDTWLPNLMILAEKEIYERYKKDYVEVKVSLDVLNDKVIIDVEEYMGTILKNLILGKKGGEKITIDLRAFTNRLLSEIIGSISKITYAGKITYDRVKDAYLKCNSTDNLLVKRWYKENEKRGVDYDKDQRNYKGRPYGFVTYLGKKNIFEDIAEMYAFLKLYPEKLEEITREDDVVKAKVLLLKEYLGELKEYADKLSLASSSLEQEAKTASSAVANLTQAVVKRLKEEYKDDTRDFLREGKISAWGQDISFEQFVKRIADELEVVLPGEFNWEAFTKEVWLEARKSPQEIILTAANELKKQREILAEVSDVTGVLPGTKRDSELQVSGYEDLESIDDARRIGYSEGAVSLDLSAPDFQSQLDRYVELPAQDIVIGILKIGGNPRSANAYGPGLKGVFWLKDGVKYFTPLTIEAYKDSELANERLKPEARGDAERGVPRIEERSDADLGKLSAAGPRDVKQGGIDLSQIELTLKDDKYISSLNPADIKILRAAKALKEEWNSLSLLYIHELILLLKDNLASDIQNKNLLSQVLRQLQSREFLDPQAIQFLNFIQANKPIGELKLALYQ